MCCIKSQNQILFSVNIKPLGEKKKISFVIYICQELFTLRAGLGRAAKELNRLRTWKCLG